MLQVNFIRQHVDLVKERLAVKHFGQPGLVDELLQLDERRRKLQFERDELQGKVNAASKDIGLLMREGKKAEAESLKAEVAAIKGRMDDVSELDGIERSINDILVQLPNLPSVQVPAGRTPAGDV